MFIMCWIVSFLSEHNFNCTTALVISTYFCYSPLTLFLSLIHKLSMALIRLQALQSGNHLLLQLSVCLWRFNATMSRTSCFPISPVHWQSSLTLYISPVTIYCCYYYYYFIGIFLSLSFNCHYYTESQSSDSFY